MRFAAFFDKFCSLRFDEFQGRSFSELWLHLAGKVAVVASKEPAELVAFVSLREGELGQSQIFQPLGV